MKPGCVVEVEGAVPKVMSVALIELVEMTATLNVVVSINSTTVMQTYWITPVFFALFVFGGSYGKIDCECRAY